MLRNHIEVPSLFGPLSAYADDTITDQIERFGNHTRPEFAFALSVLDRGMNAFDCGAHIGTFSLAASEKAGASGRLLCVEGDAQTSQLLQGNMDAHSSAPFQIENRYMGKTGRFVLRDPEGNTGASHLIPADESDSSGLEIEMTSLDDLVAANFEPDYIKIDIEGFEYILLSQSTYISSKKPIIYMEVASKQIERVGGDVEMLNSVLSKLNYRYYVNIGPRNGRHDVYRIAHIQSLDHYKPFFDALCVPAGSASDRALSACAELIS